MGKKNKKTSTTAGALAIAPMKADGMHELVGPMSLLAVKDGTKKSKEQLKTERALAVNAVFAEHLGATGTRLEGWQNACLAVHREPANSITKCKAVSL